ncbi:MAG: hypothetical protein KDJ97_12135 [Anaerolineae bacterium]|nr:hypothetical protein [Anaerolineae bacterium]
MTIDDLLIEALTVSERFWFVQDLTIAERTDATITLHFNINSGLFVQLFFSERSERLSFALVGSSGRLYGRDREHGVWHRHPFGQAEQHEPTPEGMSLQPILQFMAEVEAIVVDNNLI